MPKVPGFELTDTLDGQSALNKRRRRLYSEKWTNESGPDRRSASLEQNVDVVFGFGPHLVPIPHPDRVMAAVFVPLCPAHARLVKVFKPGKISVFALVFHKNALSLHEHAAYVAHLCPGMCVVSHLLDGSNNGHAALNRTAPPTLRVLPRALRVYSRMDGRHEFMEAM